MKLRELLTQETYERFGDMDVINDTIDDVTSCWCGTLLTPVGARTFAQALELEAEVVYAPGFGANVIEVKLTDDYDRDWRYVCRLFESMAGYCDCESYDAWFTDPNDDEAYIECQPEVALRRAIDWIVDHAHKDDLVPTLKRIGFTDRWIKENLEM